MAKKFQFQVPFKKHCGRDNQCVTDLALKATPSGEYSFIVVGHSELFKVLVELQNTGEAAYMCEVFVTFPRHAAYVQVETVTAIRHKVACLPQDDAEGDDDTHILVCEVGNPVPAGQTVIFELAFDPSAITEDVQNLTMSFLASTQSDEDDAHLTDNRQEVTFPVRVQAELSTTA